ncbi:peptide deformylase [Candidatus Parcubacteria bacterium]|nr:peptide deformylase [Candidatus Parcubacteria bacterium]
MKEELIVGREAPILRTKARLVSTSEVGSAELAKIIASMKKAVHQEDDGVAIAAPQIGKSLRIFLVKGGILKRYPEDAVFINPDIVRRGRKMHTVEEGCLSVRWLYGEVLRHERVTLKALSEDGQPITIGASGLLAQIFQHEVDHLDGILFIDKAENVRDLPPESHEQG